MENLRTVWGRSETLLKKGRKGKEGRREGTSEWVTDSSVVKALSALARGPRVRFPAPTYSSNHSHLHFQEILCRHQTGVWFIHTQAGETLIHKK